MYKKGWSSSTSHTHGAVGAELNMQKHFVPVFASSELSEQSG